MSREGRARGSCVGCGPEGTLPRKATSIASSFRADPLHQRLEVSGDDLVFTVLIRAFLPALE